MNAALLEALDDLEQFFRQASEPVEAGNARRQRRLIRENRDDLLRLVASIKFEDNTASDISRRLNSCSRQHALHRTPKSFGQIVERLFILCCVDDLDLRRTIERQLNKAELANRFTRAVAVGNPREFTQAEEEE